MSKLAIASYIWTAVNVATAPLLGWGLAQAGVSALPAFYIIFVVCMGPLALLLWSLAEQKDRTNG